MAGVSVTITVDKLRVPTFLKTTDGKKIHIKDISDEGLGMLCEQFKDDLISHARHTREQYAKTAAEATAESNEDDLT